MADANFTTYFDATTSILDDTIIVYNGVNPTVQIASEADGKRIRKIGDGAFAGSKAIRQLALDEGIEEIGTKSFNNCNALLEVHAPTTLKKVALDAFKECSSLQRVEVERKLSATDYAILKRNSIERGNQSYILPNQDMVNQYVEVGADIFDNQAHIPYNIDRDMQFLAFADQEMRVDLMSQITTIDLSGAIKPMLEKDILMRKLENDIPEPYSDAADQNIDSFYRKGKFPTVYNVAIVSFDAVKTKVTEDGFIVTFEFVKGHVFWPSVSRIKFGGRSYYIYRRMFLGDSDYNCYQVGILQVLNEDKQRCVTDEENCVKAKYKLLSVI